MLNSSTQIYPGYKQWQIKRQKYENECDGFIRWISFFLKSIATPTLSPPNVRHIYIDTISLSVINAVLNGDAQT